MRGVRPGGPSWIRTPLLALLFAALQGCGGGSERASRPGQSEFARHLHLGIEQMRHELFESAEAEFAKCSALEPDDPQLLFHLARLELAAAGRGRPPQTAVDLLERVVRAEPDNIPAHRLLYELYLRQGDSRAAAHRAAAEGPYGCVGRVDMDAFTQYIQRSQQGGPALDFDKAGEASSDCDDLARGLRMLERKGQYAPTEAVPILEELMTRYPDLAVVRFLYARKLISGEVRVNFSLRSDLPLMSSRLIADYAQAHYERVYDQTYPGSTMALDAAYQLADVALRMGDWDDAVKYYDVLLSRTDETALLHRVSLGQKGVTRFKQRRYDEAVDLLQQTLRGGSLKMQIQLPLLWVLHLAYEEAGTPAAKREFPFPFRGDLAMAGTPTPLAFEDIAPRLGIDKLDGLGPSAWGDIDGDGDFDLYVSGHDSFGALYRNDGDAFTDISVEAGLFNVQSGFSSTFNDFDNDGDPDLHIGRDGWNGPAPNSLYLNQGDGTFTEVTDRAGVGNPGSSFVHAWTDYDRDGDLDLIVANGITGAGDTNALYRNEGDGTFRDATREAGMAEPPGKKTIGVAVGDYDKDGWPDFFVSGYKTLNRLYHNKGDGTFEELAARAGVDGASHVSTGYTCFFVDYDNDTYLDILRTSLAPWHEVLIALTGKFDTLPRDARDQLLKNGPKLYRNNRDGTFTDVSARAGLVHPIGIMGSNTADVDNDGFDDLYFGTGNPRIKRLEPDRFYHNNGDGTFTEMTFAVGLGNIGKGHGVTFVDWDGDGDLEIYAQEGGFQHGDPFPNAFYLNNQSTGNHWLHVDLRGVESNRDAVGARLTVEAGDLRVYREVWGGRGFGSSDSPTVEFGLGQAGQVDRLEIIWPGGTKQTFRSLAANQRIFVEEGAEWEPWRAPGDR